MAAAARGAAWPGVAQRACPVRGSEQALDPAQAILQGRNALDRRRRLGYDGFGKRQEEQSAHGRGPSPAN